MADFEPGGQLRFFVEFAPMLLKRMRGVLHLVLEEAHLFAPKERSGMGAENLAIHWAKMLATAGRSKGIRLVILTQRTQSLHNAVLGSCETVIAHRLTTPADQKPVNDWLKANVEPAIAKEVAASLSSLKTGEGWICSGEARIFKRQMFPRIHTFDNSATPTNDQDVVDVATAAVDVAGLRAIVGDAVIQAEANDPKKLRARIAELEKERQSSATTVAQVPDPAALQAEFSRGFDAGLVCAADTDRVLVENFIGVMRQHLSDIESDAGQLLGAVRVRAAGKASSQASDSVCQFAQVGKSIEIKPVANFPTKSESSSPVSPVTERMPRAILTALAQHQRKGLSKGQILVHTGYRSSGPVSKCFAEILRQNWVNTGAGGLLHITEHGLAALGAYDRLPEGAELREHILKHRCSTMESAMMKALFEAYPKALAKGEILRITGYASSGPVSKAFAKLVALGYADKWAQGHLRASGDLF